MLRTRRLLAPLLLALLLAPPAAARPRRAPRKSPHCEIVATAVVDTEPRARTHRNRREFLEFDVVIERFARAPELEAGADPELPVAVGRRVHVVHDLTCGGSPLSLSRGERIEIQGEYVAPPDGRDLIHFTHPADGSCGRRGGHPGGFIRPAR